MIRDQSGEISPLMRYDEPVPLAQLSISAVPQMHKLYCKVRFCASKASRIVLKRFVEFDVDQSYPAGAGLVISKQVPFTPTSLELSCIHHRYWSSHSEGILQLSYFR